MRLSRSNWKEVTCMSKFENKAFVVSRLFTFLPSFISAPSPPDGFQWFVKYCSTISNHYCWVSCESVSVNNEPGEPGVSLHLVIPLPRFHTQLSPTLCYPNSFPLPFLPPPQKRAWIKYPLQVLLWSKGRHENFICVITCSLAGEDGSGKRNVTL